jgi:predicted Zn-dependent protease
MKKYSGKIVISSLVILFAVACAQVPITGRKQLKLLPESELVAMSLTSYNQFLTENEVVKNTADANKVKAAGDRISKAVTKYLEDNKYGDRVAGYNWEFNLVNDKSINAWCMPGGKVVFYSGILPVCKDETGIAVVMGHEIAHAIARHGNERMSQGLAQQLGGIALAVAVSDKPQETQQLFAIAYGLGSQFGVMLPFSRKHESEADEMGLYFMAMAGYDPKAAPAFWERMEKSSGSSVPEFLSTHPNPETRATNLKSWMPKAETYYNQVRN